MSSGVFRGKESSNRIELSRLVQDLLNFGVLGSLWLWGGGQVGWGVSAHGGCPHTCAHACSMHACTCIHVQKLQMGADMEASIFIMFIMHVHVYMHACMGHPHTHPIPSTHPPPPRGTPWNQ